MRTRTSAHLPAFGVRAVRGPPGPHGTWQRDRMRTRTSAHLPAFGACVVRGPPGPHGTWQRDRMRTRTSAHPRRSAPARCAGLPVRMNLAARRCGRGRPRTSRRSASARCAGLPARMNLAARRCGRGRPRTSQRSAPAVRGATTRRRCDCTSAPVHAVADPWRCVRRVRCRQGRGRRWRSAATRTGHSPRTRRRRRCIGLARTG